MKRFLSTENLIRATVVILLIVFASIKYDIKDVGLGLLIVFGMTLLGVSIVGIYRGIISYRKSKEWNLSRNRTLLYIFFVISIPIVFLFFLPQSLKIYSFAIVGVVLLSLLIFDTLRRLIR